MIKKIIYFYCYLFRYNRCQSRQLLSISYRSYSTKSYRCAVEKILHAFTFQVGTLFICSIMLLVQAICSKVLLRSYCIVCLNDGLSDLIRISIQAIALFVLMICISTLSKWGDRSSSLETLPRPDRGLGEVQREGFSIIILFFVSLVDSCIKVGQ